VPQFSVQENREAGGVNVITAGIKDQGAWPRITVVTPSFNQGQFLEETIRSVLMQGYPNLEYIVVDGGSTDSSIDVIKQYEPWITYWVSEKDDGQTHAITKGFAGATGQILAWLNSDDVYKPGALLTVAECFRTHPGLAIAYGSCEVIDAGSRCQAIHVPRDFELRSLLKSNYIAQPATFFSHDLYDRVGLNVGRHYAFDYELWVKAAVQGQRFVRVPGLPLAGFRVWEQSKSETSYERFIEETSEIVAEVWGGDTVPAPVQPLRNLALASGWRFAALGYWRSGQGEKARYCLRRVFKLWPMSRMEPKLLFVYMGSLFGKKVTIVLRKFKQAVNRRLHVSA
jgi:glycosyltransferase involved in cell wall biosynthesis